VTSPIAVVSSAIRSNTHLTPHVIITAPTESYYSQPEAIQSIYSQSEDVPIGQAVTAPGRVSPYANNRPSLRYSYAFPMPPTTYSVAESIHFPQPSIRHMSFTGRNLVPQTQYVPELPNPIAPYFGHSDGLDPQFHQAQGQGQGQGHHSSLFKYTDYAISVEGRISMATTRSRGVQNGNGNGEWYDRVSWDHQDAMPTESVYGMSGGGGWYTR